MEQDDQIITRGQARMDAFMTALHLIFYYAIALGIWGLAVHKSFIWFGLSGAVLGLLVSLVFVVPVIAGQRTANRSKDMIFAASALWGNFAIIIGIAGILAFVIRLIFFK